MSVSRSPLHWQRTTPAGRIGDFSDPSNILHPDPIAAISGAVTAPVQGRWLVFRAEFEPAGLVDLLVTIRFADRSTTMLRPTVVARNTFYGALKAQLPVSEVIVQVAGSGASRDPRSMQFGPERSRSHI